ncbi:hypothetical protein [Roseovarius sp. M141]|uniref:hypothetical protein n=1 Tax=Roseovarius sp. M141 TaxID=2583806 RepID=UPI0020CDC3B6|nr:hypothetical protein [Roseovarius sp. M141]MCQ0094198.1 hypothetical protein [Roseovarius sp. M141]
MKIRPAATLLACLMAILVAVTGMTSAGMLAPNRADLALAASESAHGGLGGDLCGEGRAHDHRCPLCHGLPEAPAIGHSGVAVLLTPHDGVRRLGDLYRAAQARELNHSPRAPPVLA